MLLVVLGTTTLRYLWSASNGISRSPQPVAFWGDQLVLIGVVSGRTIVRIDRRASVGNHVILAQPRVGLNQVTE